MSVKVNCLVCRGTKRVDKIGGLHTKECPNCNGAGKVEVELVCTKVEETTTISFINGKTPDKDIEIFKSEKTYVPEPKEGKAKHGKGK